MEPLKTRVPKILFYYFFYPQLLLDYRAKAFRISHRINFMKTKPWTSVGWPLSGGRDVHCCALMLHSVSFFLLHSCCALSHRGNFWWGSDCQAEDMSLNTTLSLSSRSSHSFAYQQGADPKHTLTPPSCPREYHCRQVNSFFSLHISPPGLLLSSSPSLFNGSSVWKQSLKAANIKPAAYVNGGRKKKKPWWKNTD